MSKLSKTFLLFCICSFYTLNAFSQYDPNTSVFKRKKGPTASASTPPNTKSKPSDDIYKNAGIRTAIYEEAAAEEIINNNKVDNPGHNLKRTSTNKSTFTQKTAPEYNNKASQETRNTTSFTPSRKSTIPQAQSKSPNNSPYQVKRANMKSETGNTQSGAYQNAKTLNFDVLSEGNKKSSPNNSTSTSRPYTPTQRRSTSYYSNYYNNSVKIYNQRGQQVSANHSNTNRNVIIVPRQGLTVTGIVTSDDPGRTITIKDNQGKSISYQYTDMDALVNI